MVTDPAAEAADIRLRYERRVSDIAALYAPTRPDVLLGQQALERALTRLLLRAGAAPFAERRLLDIGCGTGAYLRQFIRMGFEPAGLVGSELLPSRAARARELLPASVQVLDGNALDLALPNASFDIVSQFVVFTSILDAAFRSALARRMWDLVRPGGGIVWYDFTVDNPRNADVRGVALREVRALFPAGEVIARRVTLAPPIARSVAPLGTLPYALLDAIPLLRSHLLCWIHKP